MATRSSIVFAPVALVLASCVQEPVVDVTRQDGLVQIYVSQSGTLTNPCIRSLTVTIDGADIAQIPPVWAISTSNANECRNSFIYGQVPSGWSQGRPAPALTIGGKYLVEVSGPGLIGGRAFAARADDGPM